MHVFNQYAQYYDLIYREKDYAGEALFVQEELLRGGVAGGRLLELGSGTGRHAVEFARLGWQVDGVDLSSAMVQQARVRALQEPDFVRRRLRFQEGDVRSVRTGELYEAVVSLFHVMSYQTTNQDLMSAFATAATHLRPGGRFLFDFWYGPAVLSDPPVVRVKRFEDGAIEATRLAEPELLPNENRVMVKYEVFIKDKTTSLRSEIRESHAMRFLFLPELHLLLESAGLQIEDCGAWRGTLPLGRDTWFGWACAGLRHGRL